MIPYDQMRNTEVADMSALAQFSLLITDVLMWEIFTRGMMPYDQMRNAEVVDFVCYSSVLSLDYRCINVGDIYRWYDAV